MDRSITQSVGKPNILFGGLAIAYALSTYGIGSVTLFWLFLACTGLALFSLSDIKTDNSFAAFNVWHSCADSKSADDSSHVQVALTHF